MSRGLRFVGLLAVALLVASCGEPGNLSPRIGLARTTESSLVLFFKDCTDLKTTEVVLGSGTDRWAHPTVELVAEPVVAGSWSLPLSDPESAEFRVTDGGDVLPLLEPPFFVRVDTRSGIATSAFDRLPDVDRVLTLGPDDLGTAGTQVSVDEFLASPPEWCAP